MKTRAHTGFGLIELLIVTAILGILIAVTLPNLLRAVDKTNDTASKAYVHHVVKGIEMARNSFTNALPEPQSCAALTHVSDDPKSVTSCEYLADPDHDRYTVTATSVTGTTFQYNGSEIVLIE